MENAAPEWWSVCFYLPRRFHASNILTDSGCVRSQNSHNRRVVPYLDIPPLRLGPLSIQPFGLLVCLGAIVGLFVAKWRARQVGLDVKIVRDLVRLCCVFGLFGALIILNRALGYGTQGIWVNLAINAALPLFYPQIAWQAHVGGFLTGMALAFLYSRARRQAALAWAGTAAAGVGLAILAASRYILT